MGTLERNVTITHELGPDGRLSMKGVTGPIRVSAVPGTEARVHITYRVRASDKETAERALEQGDVRVDRGDRTLEIETPERRLSSGLAWLFGGSRVTVALAAEVPVGTRVQLETVSGTLQAQGIAGEQRYRSVSGDVRVEQARGDIDVSTVSGTVNVDGAAEVRLRAHTVSGSIWTRSPRFRALRLNTTSGDVRIAGELSPDGSYRAESISGMLELATASGVTAELKTLSGRVRSEIPHRLDGSRGQWRAILGDGSAYFRFDSMSGELRLREPIVFAAAPGAPATDTPLTGTPAPATPGDDWSADAADTPDGPVGSGAGSADGAADGSTDGSPADEALGQTGDPAEDELSLLRAVERGEISVEEAHARLGRQGR